VAIAEVDMTAQSVIDVQNKIRDASLRVFIIVLACLLAVVPLMAAIITNPLKIVTLAARALELGRAPDRTELQRATQGRDEVSQLARVFGRMADEVHAREEKLKRQVEELKIEIDTAKQESQVAEITETDFFRELQQKAQRMRARSTDPEPALRAASR
jgi:nitrate/nitrite-specific signal transduction histidine kinase